MSFTEIEHLLVILGLYLLHLLVPGPNMLYICAVASKSGRRAALAFAVGTATGTAVWAAFVAFGGWHVLAFLPPMLSDGLRILVALALLVLGVRAILAACRPSPPRDVTARSVDPNHALLTGILVTLANGSELVFWSAILAIGVGHDLSFTFLVVLVLAVAATSLAFDLTLATLATGDRASQLLFRGRRLLEGALGVGFSLTGAALLEIV